LAERTVAGVLWTSLAMGAQAVLQLVALLVLARLLSPVEFGVFAAALVVAGFSSIFAELGVGPAMVQRPTLEERHQRVGFTLSLLLGLAVAGLVWTAAPVIGRFFHLPELAPVVRAMCIVFACQGVAMAAQALAQRELRFRWLAGVDAGAFAAGFVVVGPVLAWHGMGVWSLVGAYLTQHVARMLVLLAGQPHPKRPLLEPRAIRELLYFGGGFTLARIGNYLAGQGDNLVVGRWLGAQSLGLYAYAHQLMTAPAQLLGQVLDRVLFPTMALVQLEPARLARAYRSGIAVCALVVLPASVVLATVATEVVLVLLGPAWSGATDPLRILMLGMLFRTSYKLSDSVARATGAVYARAWRQAVFACAIVIGSLIGQLWGLQGVAIGVVAAITVNFVMMAQLSLRLTSMRWREFGAAHLPGITLAATLGTIAWLLGGGLREQQMAPQVTLFVVAFVTSVSGLLLCRLVPTLFLGQEAASLLRLIATMIPMRQPRPSTRIPVQQMLERTQQALNELPPPQIAPAGLRVVRGLLARLHEADLAYCHWKSNEHLAAALDGLTDLDILVDRRRTADLQQILATCGFRRFAAPPLRAYPAVEDYLGFDHDSGRLVHLHLHYQLTLGQRHLKGYRLPWETRLLSTRILDPDHHAYVAGPAIELVLLLVRAALKLRARDRLRACFKRGRKGAVGDLHREFQWLRERVDDASVCETACGLLGPAAEVPLRRLLAEGPAPTLLRAFASAVRPQLDRHRTFGRLEAPRRALLRELQWLADAVNRRYLHRATPLRRVSPRGGTVVVLLGSDGSGKSTLARTLVAWLGTKLDVLPVYFGSGDGPPAFYRWPLLLAHRLLRPALASSRPLQPCDNKGQADPGAADPATFKASLRAAARVLWALALSCEKRAKLRRMIRARNRGMIVVCDRFPQADIPGFNDGPLLAHWHTHAWRIGRALAAWEARPYAEAVLDPPDLVIKLAVSPEVALQRRPEMTLTEIRRRVSAVQSLDFPRSTRVVEVSGDVPLDDVALAGKRLLWDEI
jgi:PST family polysaccharide transporter